MNIKNKWILASIIVFIFFSTFIFNSGDIQRQKIYLHNSSWNSFFSNDKWEFKNNFHLLINSPEKTYSQKYHLKDGFLETQTELKNNKITFNYTKKFHVIFFSEKIILLREGDGVFSRLVLLIRN